MIPSCSIMGMFRLAFLFLVQGYDKLCFNLRYWPAQSLVLIQ
jgi:hypothetical protein